MVNNLNSKSLLHWLFFSSIFFSAAACVGRCCAMLHLFRMLVAVNGHPLERMIFQEVVRYFVTRNIRMRDHKCSIESGWCIDRWEWEYFAIWNKKKLWRIETDGVLNYKKKIKLMVVISCFHQKFGAWRILSNWPFAWTLN